MSTHNNQANDLYQGLPNLKINDKNINYVKSTTVLGLLIDDDLTFKKHADKKLQQCWHTWYKITKNSTRLYGLNISSLVILFKTVVLTKLLYAAPVWFKDNIQRFKKFFSRVCLKISGATHHPSQHTVLLAAGLEPLTVHCDVITTKFILKALHSDPNMRSMILQIEGERNHPFHHHIVLAKKFLQHNTISMSNFRNRNLPELSDYNEIYTHYTKEEMGAFKRVLWKNCITTEADKKLIDLFTLTSFSGSSLNTTNHKMLFPRTSKRITDTKVMDLLHGHSLNFNSFQYTIGEVLSPACNSCSVDDDNYHQLMDCVKFNSTYRDPLSDLQPTQNIFLSVILDSNKEQLLCFRKMAQIIIN